MNNFIFVANPFTLIRFRAALEANIGSNLTDHLLVSPFDNDPSLPAPDAIGNFYFNTIRCFINNSMRITDVERKFLTLNFGPVPNTE